MVRWLGALLGVVVLSGVAGAQERARILTPLPGDLDARIDGQTSDLGWALERRAGVAGDLDAAEAVAERARVVVWVSHTSRGLRLHFADVHARRLLVRDFDAPASDAASGASSATLESVAVALRSALVALSLGGEVGVVVPAPPEAALPASEPERQIGVEATLGWAVGVDGESPVQQGPSLGLALRAGRVAFGARADLGLGASLDDARSQLRLTRHVVALELAATLLSTAPVALDASLRVGVARYRRGEVEPLASDVVPTPASASWSPLVGLGLGALFAPGARVGVLFQLEADFVPGAPELRYERGGELIIRNNLWRLQPRAALSLVIRSGP